MIEEEDNLLPDGVSLRDYIESLFAEKEKALFQAAQERDRAAEVLRDEQRRALLVAEVEREKAAAALRAGTDRAINDNFSRLTERLDAMDKSSGESERHRKELDMERGRALEAAFAAAEKAVVKAEEAQARVNVNLSEQAGMPRREVEALLHEQSRQMGELRDAMGTLRTAVAVGPVGLAPLQLGQAQQLGQQQGAQNFKAAIYAFAASLVGIGGLITAIVALN